VGLAIRLGIKMSKARSANDAFFKGCTVIGIGCCGFSSTQGTKRSKTGTNIDRITVDPLFWFPENLNILDIAKYVP
jgi:hypothetical protein